MLCPGFVRHAHRRSRSATGPPRSGTPDATERHPTFEEMIARRDRRRAAARRGRCAGGRRGDARALLHPAAPRVTTTRVRERMEDILENRHRRGAVARRSQRREPMQPFPPWALGHPRALQHRGRLHRRAPRHARSADARRGDRRRRRARRPARSPSRSSPSGRAASRSCCATSASRPATACSIRLPNCLDYPTAFLGAMKRGAIAGADVDAAHRRRGAATSPRDSGAVAMVTDRRDVGRDARRRSSGSRRLRDVILVGDGDARRRDALARPRPRASARRASRAGSRRTRRAPTTPRTSSTPPARPAIRRACCTRTARSSAASRRRSTGSTSTRAATACCTPASTTGPTCSAPGSWIRSIAATRRSCTRARTTPHVWPRLHRRATARPIFIGVPTIYRQILQKTAYGRADVPTLRHCMSAGEQLSGEVLAAWRDALRPRHLRRRSA